MLNLVRAALVGAALVFVAMLVMEGQAGSTLEDFFGIFQVPWGTETVVDLYLGFTLSALVIILFEKHLAAGLAWGLSVILLGNAVSLVWFAWRLPELVGRLRG